jgi:formylglycine-generating enzyme required for sulfatase activity
MGAMGAMGAMGKQGLPGIGGSAIPDCPEDYTQDMTVMGMILCKKGNDEIVKVGKGRSSFWIDRYEASVWSDEAGAVTQYGANMDDYPATFPDNGQYATAVYAVSKSGVKPSAYLTWFQAHAACAASGKRLPTRNEWLEAVRGTVDPGASNGAGGVCVTQAPDPRMTGLATQCKSRWGVEDMIGNVWEWTDEWASGVGTGAFFNTPWPAGFGGDVTYNIASRAYTGSGFPSGIPAAALRGGGPGDGTGSGIFALTFNSAPIDAEFYFGFRCVVPR